MALDRSNSSNLEQLALKGLIVLVNAQEKDGSRCSFGDSLIVCQPMCSVQTGNAQSMHDTSAESNQLSNEDEPEPMQVSLDLAINDTGEEMAVQEELEESDSVVVTSAEHAATSS